MLLYFMMMNGYMKLVINHPTKKQLIEMNFN